MKLTSAITALMIAAASAAASSAAFAQQPGPLSRATEALRSSAVRLPAEGEQIRLVHETMDIFIEGMKAKTFHALWEHSSLLVQRKFTPQQIDEIFKDFLKIPVTGKPLQSLVPIFSVEPEAKGENAFRVQGYYATQPQNVSFDITYAREGLGWKVAAIHVRILPAKKPAAS
ncbi:MAG: hypothetical protein R3D68_09010 [Hyphomicrobiaceae bacterium]